MVFPQFVLYGRGTSVDSDVLLYRSTGASLVTVRYAATHMSPLLGLHGTLDWYVGGDQITTDLTATAMLEVDTVPPDQGDLNTFGLPGDNGAVLILPLEDGTFFIAAGIFVYRSTPDATSYDTRLQLNNVSAGGAHYPVAISLQGTTVRVLYATRGNSTQHAFLLTHDLGDPLTGTLDATTLPQYTGSVTWPISLGEKYNWFTGLIPNVMGAFDYCIYRNADRSGDGTNYLGVGVATSAPFSEGGAMKMLSFEVVRGSGSTANFESVTAGGTMTGSALTAQSYLAVTIATSADVIAAAPGIDPGDYFFDELIGSLLLSFETPTVPLFWTNLRAAVEVA